MGLNDRRQRLEQAQHAIGLIVTDTTVPTEATLQDLRNLQELLDLWITSIDDARKATPFRCRVCGYNAPTQAALGRHLSEWDPASSRP